MAKVRSALNVLPNFTILRRAIAQDARGFLTSAIAPLPFLRDILYAGPSSAFDIWVLKR